MEITIQQIYDFNACPMLYKFKHEMKIDRPQPFSLDAEFHGAIRKSIMYFYYQILNNREPTLDELIQKFGSIFYKDMTPRDILGYTTLNSNSNALALQGVKTITAFYEREAKKKFVPIGVDMDVRVPVGDHYLMTTVDLIREMKYNERKLIEIVRFTNTNKNVDSFYVNHDLTLTAHSYAFRKLFQTTENRIIMQVMKSGKEHFTIRKESELNRLEAIVNGVCDSISKNRFYPVHNLRCNTCVYKDACNKYKF